MAFCLLAPVTLAPRGQRFAVLDSAVIGMLGRWSYGVFLWHVLVLHFAFQIAAVPMFSGQMLRIWLVTDNDFRRRLPTELVALDWRP